MENRTLRKWLLFALFFLFVTASAPLLWAQPEEEEEPIQARPNPLEQTTIQKRGATSSRSGQAVGAPSRSLKKKSQRSGKNIADKIPHSTPIPRGPGGLSYGKYDGVDGESKDEDHKEWIDLGQWSPLDQGGMLYLIQKKGGAKKLVSKDGTYRFADGRVFEVKNGMIIRRMLNKPRPLTKPRPLMK